MSLPYLLSSELLAASAVLDALVEGVLLIDQENRIAWINRPLERLLGIDRNTLHGIDADRFVHLHLAPCITGEACTAQVAASFSAQPGAGEIACTFRPPDGSKRRVLISGTAVQCGQSGGMRLVRFLDITERKRAEQKLLQSEETFREVFISMGVGFVLHEMVYDSERRPVDCIVLDVDPAYESVTGSYRERVIGRRITEISPGIEPIWLERYDTVLRTQRPVRFEEYNRESGRWYGINAYPMREENRFTVIFTDITGWKQAEESLRENEERLRAAVENSPDAVYRRDLTADRYIYMSPVIKQILGFTPEEMNAMDIGEVLDRIHPEDRSFAEEEIDHAVAVGQGTLEYRFRAKNGDYRWLADRFTVTRDADGRPLFRGGVVRDITERKKAEEELQSLARFPAENPNPTLRLENGRVVVYANGAAREMLAGSGGDLPGEIARTAEATLASGVRQEVERRIGADTYLLTLVPFTDRCYVNVYGKKITERKRTEEALRESEEQYRTLFESACDALLIHDLDGDLLDVNRAAVGRLGYSREELLTMHLTDIVTPESAALVPDRIRKVAERGHAFFETAHMTRDGRSIPVEASVRVIPFRGEAAVLAVSRDITERKRAEEELRHQAEMFRRLIDTIPAMIAIFDPQLRRFRFNRPFREILGWTEEDAAGGDFMARVYPDPAYREKAAAFMQSPEPGWQDFLATAKDGGTVESSWANVSLADDTRIGIGIDIREQKRVEEVLRRKSREVEAARDEANIYLDILTHDVRNANNVSGMYADLLVDLAEGNLKAYAEKLRDSVDRSNEILRNVATIRRASEETGLVPVNLDALIREEIANFPNAAIRYADLRIEVLADNLLPTVFTNLIGNAVKYGGPAVEIAVRVECDDGTVRVSVEDTGPGVPDEVKGKLFTRFERGRASGRGQGLGLYIVRTLVERYGGSTWVEDRVAGRPEEGAAFRFTLRKIA